MRDKPWWVVLWPDGSARVGGHLVGETSEHGVPEAIKEKDGFTPRPSGGRNRQAGFDRCTATIGINRP